MNLGLLHGLTKLQWSTNYINELKKWLCPTFFEKADFRRSRNLIDSGLSQETRFIDSGLSQETRFIDSGLSQETRFGSKSRTRLMDSGHLHGLTKLQWSKYK